MSEDRDKPPVLLLRGVGLVRNGRTILSGVSLWLMPGEVVAVVGPNGAGKTSLLRVAAGLTPPSEGEVWVEGVAWRPAGGGQGHARGQVSLLAHEDMLYLDLSPWENLVFHGRLYGLEKGQAEFRAEELLDELGLLLVADLPVRLLSRGMQRRVALARLFLRPASLLLLDEPEASLDPEGVAWLVERLGKRRRPGEQAVLLTAARPGQILSVVHRTVRLEAGRVVAEPGAAGSE
ncbi:MAG TPA: heme ABC exporter ATP-binding protein CcmA [Firmicutes bacterium]|nr:heme ABC exporter ATP-binding protein CcmA [Bacillota bacterium]